MAISAIAAAAAVASAAAGTYGAVSSGQNQRAGNAINAANFAQNRANSTQNTLLDALNTLQNTDQRALDNSRYDVALGKEDKQRAFLNALATATQRDADGNSVQYDPTTNTWRTVSTGIGLTNVQRRQQQDSANYTQALLGSTLGNMRTQDRLRDQGVEQSQSRALAQELLSKYAANQGRTPAQMEAAGIERNVAQVTDPLRTGGNMAMLAGYRQGNSGNDALLGALARQSQGGTRAAIAQARYDAPGASYAEQEAAANAALKPSTTLAERGNAAPGSPAPTFTGDSTNALLSAIQRGNGAGLGSQLNPRAGAPLGVGRSATNMQGYTPLNASGNEAGGLAAVFKGLSQNDDVKNTTQRLINWWNGTSQPYAPNAPKNYADSGSQAGDYPNV